MQFLPAFRAGLGVRHFEPVEGVSLVNNYRTQFNTIIVQDSYAALVKQMRLKLEQEQAISPQPG